MRNLFTGACLLLACLLLPLGCGSARRGEPFAPALDARSQDVARGERVFMHYCNQCHPGGETGIGPAINNKPLPGFMMKFQVRNGVGAMPGFSPEYISDEDLDGLVRYLKTVRRQPGYRPPGDA